MLAVNYLCLHRDSQPDLEVLKEKGWTPPLDLSRAGNCLVKEFKNLEFQIVQHKIREHEKERTYTEIFLHSKGEREKISRKGYGKYFSPKEAYEALKWLEKELE